MSKDAQPQTGDRKYLSFYERQYIVDKPFQYRLIGTLMALWLANSIFFTIVLYFFFEGHLKHFYDLVPRPGMLPLVSLPGLFLLSVGFVFAFGFVILSIIAIYMSNQIAGPLFRTKRCLDRVGKGDFAFTLQFRQGDFLRDVPTIFNGMLEGLRRQVEMEVEELKAMEAATEDPAQLKRLLRKQRERKESQLGVSGNGSDATGADPVPVSVAVH